MTSLDEVLRRVGDRSATGADLAYLRELITADRAGPQAAGRERATHKIVDALLLIVRTEELYSFDPPGPLDLLCEIGDAKVMAGLAALAADNTVDPVNRMEAARCLGAIGDAEDAGEALLILSAEELRSSQTWIRIRSAEAAADLGREDEAVGILLAMATDRKLDMDVRVSSAVVVSNLGHISQAAPVLIELADSDSMDLSARARAAVTAVVGTKPDTTIRRLRRLVHMYLEWSSDIRKEIALALVRVGDEQTGLEVLQRMAHDRNLDGYMQVECAVALIEFGSTDSAVSALLAILHGALEINDEAYKKAARALADVRGLAAADVLQSLAHDIDAPAETRLKAALTLGWLGRRAPAAKVVVSLSTREDIESSVRLAAAKSLVGLGHAADVVPVLTSIALNENLDDASRWDAFEEMRSVADPARCADVLLFLGRTISKSLDRSRQIAEAMAELGLFDDLIAEVRHPSGLGIADLVPSIFAEAGRERELGLIIGDYDLNENVWLSAAHEVLRQHPGSPLRAEVQRLARTSTVDPSIRLFAADMLSWCGDATEELEIWREIVTGHDPRIGDWDRYSAATSLHNAGEAEAACDVFMTLARSDAVMKEVRASAAFQLNEMGEPEVAVEVLSGILDDPALWIESRIAAAKFLAEHGRATEAHSSLLRMATTPDLGPWDRLKVCETMVELGWADHIVGPIKELALLHSERAGLVAHEAIEILAKLGRVQALIDVCRKNHTGATVAAAALGELAEKDVIEDVAMDRGVDGYARLTLARRLTQLDADVGTHVLTDLCNMSENSTDVRLDAARELIRIGHESEVADLLLEWLGRLGGKPMARGQIINVLMDLGRIAELEHAMRDQTLAPDVIADIAHDLAKRGIAEGASVLLALAADTRVPPDVRSMVCDRDLPAMDHSEEAVKILSRLVQHPREGERVHPAATRSLCRLAPAHVLIDLATDEYVDLETRLQAAITLRKLGYSAQAIPALWELARLKQATPTLRFLAVTALPARGRKRDIRMILRQFLHSTDADEWIREAAATRLASL